MNFEGKLLTWDCIFFFFVRKKLDAKVLYHKSLVNFLSFDFHFKQMVDECVHHQT